MTSDNITKVKIVIIIILIRLTKIEKLNTLFLQMIFWLQKL